MSYFNHDYASRSDVKSAMDRFNPKREMPVNLDAIFTLGTLNHHALLEPHLADKDHPEYKTANAMATTVLRDPICSRLIMMPDFRREHEWYRTQRWGLKGVRCKTDGDSRAMSCVFEYKGLGVTSDKQFHDAIMSFDYDMSAYWYMNVTGLSQYLIVGVSKKNPDLIFKRIIDRNHPYYHSGAIKTETHIKVWKQFGFE